MTRLLFLVAAVAAAIAAPVALSGAGAADRPAPVVLSFEKHAVSGNVYVGTIQGGGTIEVLMLERRFTDDVQHFRALFRVDVGDKWFATILRGTFEFATLETHLKGRVTHGNWLRGARVLEAGQLVATDPLTFTGTLTLKPGSEDD